MIWPFPLASLYLWLSLWAITCDVVHAHVSPEWLRVIINAATFIAMAAIVIHFLFKSAGEDDSPAADDASTVSNEEESTGNNA